MSGVVGVGECGSVPGAVGERSRVLGAVGVDVGERGSVLGTVGASVTTTTTDWRQVMRSGMADVLRARGTASERDSEREQVSAPPPPGSARERLEARRTAYALRAQRQQQQKTPRQADGSVKHVRAFADWNKFTAARKGLFGLFHHIRVTEEIPFQAGVSQAATIDKRNGKPKCAGMRVIHVLCVLWKAFFRSHLLVNGPFSSPNWAYGGVRGRRKEGLITCIRVGLWKAMQAGVPTLLKSFDLTNAFACGDLEHL